MHANLLTGAREKTFAIVIETGEEAIASLKAFARRHRVEVGRFSAIGAFREGTLGYFDWERKAYERLPFTEQVEVLSLTGDLTVDASGEPEVQTHVVLGRADGSVRGGHLLDGLVRPTLEVLFMEAPPGLSRRLDPLSGLALIRMETPAPAVRQAT